MKTVFSHLEPYTRQPAVVHVHAVHTREATAKKEYSSLPWAAYIKQAFTAARKQIVWCIGIGMNSIQEVDRNTLMEPSLSYLSLCRESFLHWAKTKLYISASFPLKGQQSTKLFLAGLYKWKGVGNNLTELKTKYYGTTKPTI